MSKTKKKFWLSHAWGHRRLICCSSPSVTKTNGAVWVPGMSLGVWCSCELDDHTKPFLGWVQKLASLHCSWLENDHFFLSSLFLVREWCFLSVFSYFPGFYFLFRLSTLFIHSITTSASSDKSNWRVWGFDQVQNQLMHPSRVWHWRYQCIHEFNTTCHVTTALQSSSISR